MKPFIITSLLACAGLAHGAEPQPQKTEPVVAVATAASADSHDCDCASCKVAASGMSAGGGAGGAGVFAFAPKSNPQANSSGEGQRKRIMNTRKALTVETPKSEVRTIILSPDRGSDEQGPRLGVMLDEEDAGLRIVGVLDDSPAKRAGIEEDDVIIMVNDVAPATLEQLREALDASESKFTIRRGDSNTFRVGIKQPARGENSRHEAGHEAHEDGEHPHHEAHQDGDGAGHGGARVFRRQSGSAAGGRHADDNIDSDVIVMKLNEGLAAAAEALKKAGIDLDFSINLDDDRWNAQVQGFRESMESMMKSFKGVDGNARESAEKAITEVFRNLHRGGGGNTIVFSTDEDRAPHGASGVGGPSSDQAPGHAPSAGNDAQAHRETMLKKALESAQTQLQRAQESAQTQRRRAEEIAQTQRQRVEEDVKELRRNQDSDTRLKKLEARMDRIEALLERLTEQR